MTALVVVPWLLYLKQTVLYTDQGEGSVLQSLESDRQMVLNAHVRNDVIGTEMATKNDSSLSEVKQVKEVEPIRPTPPIDIIRRKATRKPLPPNCQSLHYSKDRLPLTALASFPGAGNTWLRHLIQQATGSS